MPSAVVEGLPGIVDELFDELTQDDVAERSRGLDEVLKRLSEAEGLPVAIANSSAQVFDHRAPGACTNRHFAEWCNVGGWSRLSAARFAKHGGAVTGAVTGAEESADEAAANVNATQAQLTGVNKEGHTSLLERIITEANDEDGRSKTPQTK